MKPLNIGLIGYGFMGRTHSNAFRQAPQLLRPAVSSRCSRRSARATPTRAKAFADNWGYESVETDWRKLVERKDIDAIDICTPEQHCTPRSPSPRREAGKMMLCEKPLGR